MTEYTFICALKGVWHAEIYQGRAGMDDLMMHI